MSANPLSPIPPLGPTTGMTQAPASGRFKPIDPLRVLRQNIRILIVAAVVGLLLGGGLWFALRKFAPQYTSIAQLRVSAGLQSAEAIGTVESIGHLDIMNAQMQNEVMSIKSQGVLQEAIVRPAVQDTKWFAQFDGDLRMARETLEQDNLSVSPVTGTTLIQLSVQTRHADDAPVILDAIMTVYLQKLQSDSSRESEGTRRAFLQEQQRADDMVRQLEAQIREYTSVEELETSNISTSAEAIRYAELAQAETQLEMGVENAKISAENLAKSAAEGNYEPTADDLLTMESMPVILGIKQRIKQFRELERTFAAELGENHRITRQYQSQIEAAELEKKLEMEQLFQKLQRQKLDQAQQALTGLEGSLAQLRIKLAEAKRQMTDLTDKVTRYKQLTDNLEIAQAKFREADAKLAEIRVLKERPEANRVRLQAGATIPRMTFPKMTVIVPGVTFFVLLLTTGVVFLRELLDQRVSSPSDVKLLEDAELLGVLPDVNEDPSGKGVIERIVQKDPSGLLAETFRQVRTAILAKMDRRGYKTLLLVGAQKSVGTSSLTHNLATSLAFNGRKVLIIDANFRRPAQHKLARLGGEHGLSEVLDGTADVDETIEKSEDLSLWVLAAGNGHEIHPEVFEGQKFRRMLSELETRFDIILIDAPPALLASDSQMLAKHVDAIALVLRAGQDKRGMIGRMIRQLDGHRADLLGVILNGVRSSVGGYFRKNYRDYYQYRNGAGNGHRRPAKSSRIETEADQAAPTE